MQRPCLGSVASLHGEVSRVQRIRHNQREQQAPNHRNPLLDPTGGSVGDHRVRHGLVGIRSVPRLRGQRENGRDREREDLKKKKKRFEKVFSFFVFDFEFEFFQFNFFKIIFIFLLIKMLICH